MKDAAGSSGHEPGVPGSIKVKKEAPIRWMRVLVAALAVVPVHAQVPQPAWNATFPGQLTAAFPEQAQAPGPASSSPVAESSQQSMGASRAASRTSSASSGPEAKAKDNSGRSKPSSKKSLKYDVSQIGNRPVGKGVNFYSLEKEQQLGRELASELEAQVRLLNDPVVTEYVTRIGQNLVRNSDAQVPFTIRVIDDEEINAMALPGGYFYVNSGLILAADNEAELAGVMAHEIAHVACRHATRAMTKGRIWNMASLPLIFVGGAPGYAVRQLIAVGLPISSMKFSRDAEREADLLGLEYQYAAGYDPAEFVQFFEKVHALERHGKQSFVSKLFSTHPMTEDRIRRAQAEISTLLPPKDQYLVSTSEFDEVKTRLAGVTRLRVNSANANRPTLRRRTPDHEADKDTTPDGTSSDDQRPTLGRKSE